jgi:hypothetical protein
LAGTAAFTVMTTSSEAESRLSLAVSRNVYVPAIENVAVVLRDVAFPNVTVPGPLTVLQDLVSVLPVGNPSSVAEPDNVVDAGCVTVDADTGNVMVWSGPAFTTGFVLVCPTGFTVMMTSSDDDNAPSLAVSRNVYVPEVDMTADAFNELTLTKTTVPGPLTFVQLTEIVLPDGRPSSVAVPDNVGPAGRVTVWSGPAFTTGALFVPDEALTTIIMSSVVVAFPSLAVSRKV